MQTLESTVKDLEKIALEGGATAVKLISPQDVVVGEKQVPGRLPLLR